MEWAIPGILYAFFNSIVIFTNEKFKMASTILGMFRGFGSMLVITPFLFFVPVPHGWVFWTFAILQGIMVGFFDYKLFSASARFGAGGTAMMTVLAIILTIVLWWFIQFNQLWDLLHNPFIFAGILLSISGCVWGYITLVGKQMTRELFFYMLPAVIALVLMTLNSKFMSGRAPLAETTIYYVFIIGIVGGLFNFVLYLMRHKQQPFKHLFSEIKTKTYLQGGGLMVLCSVLLMTFKNDAMRYIPNPGYLNTLALTSPLWILLLNRIEKIQTRVSIPAVLFTLMAIACLVYFSNIEMAAVPY